MTISSPGLYLKIRSISTDRLRDLLVWWRDALIQLQVRKSSKWPNENFGKGFTFTHFLSIL